MKNLLFILAVAGAFNYVDSKQGVDWAWYSPEVEDFKVLFPNSDAPEIKKPEIFSSELEGSHYISKRPLGLLGIDDLHCEVLFGELKQSIYHNEELDYDQVKRQIQKKLLAELVSERDVDWLGYSAKEYVFNGKVSKTTATVRTIYDKRQNIFAQLIFVQPKDRELISEKERFFGSFQLL